MRESRPSRTALMVAMRRAAHQMYDHPLVLEDPIAIPIIGPGSAARVKDERGRLVTGPGRTIRAFMVARARYAEDQLALAVTRGTKQYVVLGAGLDTFAYRNPHAEAGLHVFEVDFPATQEWKRERLSAAGTAIPSSVTFAPVDFEHQTLPEGLQQAGFDAKKPAFFSWLGVTMYLERDTVIRTFKFIASCPPGGGVAFDYSVARDSLNLLERLALDAMSRRVAAVGEPFRTFFDPASLAGELQAMGFRSVEDLGKEEINARYFKNRADGLRIRGGLAHLMGAQV